MDIATSHAAIDLLASIWPRCFSPRLTHRKPLKIGIGKEIAAAVDGALTAEELDAALRLYTTQKAYLRTLREGAQRIDLDGNPAGTVTADHAANARRHIERIERRHSERVRARGLAKEAAALKAKAGAEAAERAHDEARRAAEGRKPVLRLLPSVAA